MENKEKPLIEIETFNSVYQLLISIEERQFILRKIKNVPEEATHPIKVGEEFRGESIKISLGGLHGIEFQLNDGKVLKTSPLMKIRPVH